MSFNDTFASVVEQEWNDVAGGVRAETPGWMPEPAHGERARRAALELKIASVSGALMIASSPNPPVAVADMITLITLQRRSLQDPWALDLFGTTTAEHLADTYQTQEDRIWAIGKQVFTEDQQTQLENLILQWRRDHPEQRYVAGVRLETFARARQTAMGTQAGGSGSLLALVMLDPLAGLDPATREVQQSRMLAERMFFYTSHLPQILKWHAQSLADTVLGQGAVKQSVAAVARISEAADRISAVTEQLPTERKAALDQFFGGVTEQREALMTDLRDDGGRIGKTLGELRETVNASQELSKSLTGTIGAAQKLAEQFNSPPAVARPLGEAEPSTLDQYESAAKHTTVAADRLTNAIDHLQALVRSDGWRSVSESMEHTTVHIEGSARRLVDQAFWRLLTIVIIAPLAIAGAWITLHWVKRRLDH